MLVDTNKNSNKEVSATLLEVKGLRIEGLSEKGWQEIVCGVDLTLKRGEILGLIGESGAGKSTIGLAAMGYARDGCRITAGEIMFSMASSCIPHLKMKRENSAEPEFLMLLKAPPQLLIPLTDCLSNSQKGL